MIDRDKVRRVMADRISEKVREVRLERIGEPTNGAHVGFGALPEEDQRNWLDVAEAVLRISERG